MICRTMKRLNNPIISSHISPYFVNAGMAPEPLYLSKSPDT